jgi:hypothetical protein
MSMIERLTIRRKDATLPVIAVVAWLSAWFVSCPQDSVGFASVAGVEITVPLPLPGPIMVSIADNDDREFQEEELEPFGLPGVRVVPPPSFTPSQIMPPQSGFISLLTPAQHPLRC